MSRALPPLPESIHAARMPPWSPETAVERGCPVCAARGASELCRRPDGFVVARCACGMIYLPRVPSPSELEQFYAGYAEFKGYQRPTDSSSRWRLAIDSLRDTYLSILEATGGVRGRSVMEIGASYGRFLERLRFRGAEVFAVELDAGARARLAKQGIAAAPEMPDRSFDVVCAFELLEHLADPGRLVADAERALKRDGRLLLSVPNAGQVDEIGESWVGFRVDLEHLNYFSARTLGRLLAARGLYVEQFWTMMQPGLFRSNEPSPPAPLWDRIGRALGNKLFEGQRIARSGSYGLSVLARKVA